MAANSEVTAADIARIAGVGRAAVSNWRRRHPDFPQPIGGPTTSPTFDLDEIQAWLQANGRTLTVNTPAHPRQPSLTEEPKIAAVLAALLPDLREGVVLDPACGSGALLDAAAARLGPKVRYVGQNSDASNGYPIGNPLDSDALADYRLNADAVICAPPAGPLKGPMDDRHWEFGPPSSSDGAFAWLQLCFEYVKPGGSAVLLLPFSTAVRGSGRRIRAELLRAGVLQRVIALPPPPGRSVATPQQIWVLERPVGRPSYSVEMVDLTDTEYDDLPVTPHAWHAVLTDATLSRVIPAIELLDDDVLLLPASHIEPAPRDYQEELATQAKQYRAATRVLPADPPRLNAATDAFRAPMTTVADLARLGALEYVDRHAPLESGDVLIPGGGNRFEATVVAQVDEGTESAAKGDEVLRCDPAQLDPYFVACFLRSAANRRQAAGTLGGTFRLDLRRARIPRLPLEEQQRYAQAYRMILDFSDRAEAIAEAAQAIARTTVDGLTAGALQPPATSKD